MDATPRAAEHFAANVALAAAAAANRDVMLMIDNAGVCRKVIAAFRGQLLEQAENSAFWQHTVELCGQRQHAGAWVPSHGKRPDWHAPAGYTADECRQGNDAADEECTRVKVRWMRTRSDYTQKRYEAEQWSRKALTVLTASWTVPQQQEMQPAGVSQNSTVASTSWPPQRRCREKQRPRPCFCEQ